MRSDSELQIKQALKDSSRIAVLGIGSELHSDDAAGPLAIRRLKAMSGSCPQFALFDCGTAPESFTGPIKAFRPSHLIIIDAADFGDTAGTIRVFDPMDTAGSPSATHLLPFAVIAGYLKTETGCSIILIGIQPGDLSFGGHISKNVSSSVNKVAKWITEAVNRIA